MSERRYWLSWTARDEHGPWELHSPWWISGYACMSDGSDRPTVCAAVIANTKADAIAKVMAAHDTPPKTLDMRFCEERPAYWSPFSERFPRGSWMQWPATPPAEAEGE